MNDRTCQLDALARGIDRAARQVHDDVDKVEFWAVALSGFAAPIAGGPFDLPAQRNAAQPV